MRDYLLCDVCVAFAALGDGERENTTSFLQFDGPLSSMDGFLTPTANVLLLIITATNDTSSVPCLVCVVWSSNTGRHIFAI